jgi:hypothetical protein
MIAAVSAGRLSWNDDDERDHAAEASTTGTGRTVLASAPGAQVCWHRIEPMAPVCDLLPPLARPDRTGTILQKGQAHVTSPADLPRGER